MKLWKPFLLGLWVVILILLLVFYIIPQEEALQNDTIEKLEEANKQLELKNVSLDLEITTLKKQADSISGHIILSNQTVKKLENELNEKINRINAMSTMDLYGYFTGFKTDSTGHR
jgi:peptidoglycan hydrolase CwlO-like protein